jgi:hypothetical protein
MYELKSGFLHSGKNSYYDCLAKKQIGEEKVENKIWGKNQAF